MFYQIKFLQVTKLINKFCAVCVVIIVIFSSCTPALKFSSVKYDAASINKLLDEGKMDRLIFQFYSEDVTNFKTPYKLTSFALTADNRIIDIKPYILDTVGSKPKSFKRIKVSGNIVATRKNIEDVLTDPETHKRITDYDYLLFTPYIYPETNYTSYTMSAHSGTTNTVYSITIKLPPCPPAVCFNPQ